MSTYKCMSCGILTDILPPCPQCIKYMGPALARKLVVFAARKIIREAESRYAEQVLLNARRDASSLPAYVIPSGEDEDNVRMAYEILAAAYKEKARSDAPWREESAA